jgi:hypothetical protein
MGKGTIISHIADGQYSVAVNYDTSAISARLTILADRKTLLETELSTEQAKDEPDEIRARLLKLKILSVEKQIAYLQNTSKVPADFNTMAWCADYTLDLSGEVGLIEVGREKENGINIQPGYDGNAVYSSTRDGQLVPLMAQDSAATFYNLAMLPGFQKWKPMYRYGTLTSVDYDEDTCNVTLDSISSSQQGLNINESTALTDVPIEYMDCNSQPFAEDDEVVVKFENHDFDSPKVIGFKKEPKPCTCWEEPWDGPLWTSLYQWQYTTTSTVVSVPASEALAAPTISIEQSGVEPDIMSQVKVEIPDTPNTQEYWQYYYVFYYLPTETIRKDVQTVVCALTDAFVRRGDGVVTFNSFEIVFDTEDGYCFSFFVVDGTDDGLTPYIRNTGQTATDEWQKGTNGYYMKLELNDYAPKTLPERKTVTGIRMIFEGHAYALGIPPYIPEDYLHGGGFTIDYIALC